MFTMPDGITFDSRFDSGNLYKIEENYTMLSSKDLREFNIWTASDDPMNSDPRDNSTTTGWFYFSVRNVAGCPRFKFNVFNMSMNQKLF